MWRLRAVEYFRSSTARIAWAVMHFWLILTCKDLQKARREEIGSVLRRLQTNEATWGRSRVRVPCNSSSFCKGRSRLVVVQGIASSRSCSLLLRCCWSSIATRFLFQSTWFVNRLGRGVLSYRLLGWEGCLLNEEWWAVGLEMIFQRRSWGGFKINVTSI